RMQAGGPGAKRARDELLEAHMKFVVSIARRSFKGGVPLEDLIQEGNIGLMQAADRFQLEKGTRFATYAYWWVREAIAMHVKGDGQMIPLSANRLREVRKLQLTMAKLTARSLPLTDEALASEMDMSTADLRALVMDSLSVSS